jgi:hypothetical protein
MSYQLLAHGFLPVSIAKETRLDYFNALEAYAVHGDLKPFTDMPMNDILKVDAKQELIQSFEQPFYFNIGILSSHIIPKRINNIFLFDLTNGIQHCNKHNKENAEHADSDAGPGQHKNDTVLSS